MPAIKAPAITVAYVSKGFFEQFALITYGYRSLAEMCNHQGELECVEYIASLADLVERAWRKLMRKDPDGWGGVWEYDVSEVFGKKLADHVVSQCALPTEAQAQRMLDSIIENAQAEAA